LEQKVARSTTLSAIPDYINLSNQSSGLMLVVDKCQTNAGNARLVKNHHNAPFFGDWDRFPQTKQQKSNARIGAVMN